MAGMIAPWLFAAACAICAGGATWLMWTAQRKAEAALIQVVEAEEAVRQARADADKLRSQVESMTQATKEAEESARKREEFTNAEFRKAEAAHRAAQNLIQAFGSDLKEELTRVGLTSLHQKLNQIAEAYLRDYPAPALDEVALRERNILLNDAAQQYIQQLRGAEAVESAEESVKIAKELLTRNPENLTYLHDLAVSHQRLGSAKHILHGAKEALVDYQAYHEISAKLYRLDPSPDNLRSVAISHLKIGSVKRELKDAWAGLEDHETCNRLMVQLYKEEPIPRNRIYLAQSHENLGKIKREAIGPKAALTELDRAFQLYLADDQESPSVATRKKLAWLQLDIGSNKFEAEGATAALPHFEMSRDILATLTQSEQDAELLNLHAYILLKFGYVKEAKGDLPAALKMLQESLAIYTKLHQASPGVDSATNLAEVHRCIALTYRMQAKAEADPEKAKACEAGFAKNIRAVCDLLTPHAERGALRKPQQAWLTESQEYLLKLEAPEH